jgi:hypothetical protein
MKTQILLALAGVSIMPVGDIPKFDPTKPYEDLVDTATLACKGTTTSPAKPNEKEPIIAVLCLKHPLRWLALQGVVR